MDGINKKLFKVENIPEDAEYDQACLEFDTVNSFLVTVRTMIDATLSRKTESWNNFWKKKVQFYGNLFQLLSFRRDLTENFDLFWKNFCFKRFLLKNNQILIFIKKIKIDKNPN